MDEIFFNKIWVAALTELKNFMPFHRKCSEVWSAISHMSSNGQLWLVDQMKENLFFYQIDLWLEANWIEK